MSSAMYVIKANPDVSGIGIRASIYTFYLGGTVVSYAPSHLPKVWRSSAQPSTRPSATSSPFSTTFAWCILALLGLNLVSKGLYTGLGPWRLWCFAVIHVLSLAAFIAFNVYLWITSPYFGSQPTCNTDTVYVVFGVSINATSPVFRYIIVSTLASGAAGFILVFTGMLPCLCGMLVSWRRRPRRGAQSHGKRGCIQYFVRTSIGAEVQHHGAEERLSRETLLHLEQTIARNDPDPEEKGWTFGQTIAIFRLLVVANELLNVVLAS